MTVLREFDEKIENRLALWDSNAVPLVQRIAAIV